MDINAKFMQFRVDIETRTVPSGTPEVNEVGIVGIRIFNPLVRR